MSEKPFRTAGVQGTKVEDLTILDLRASDDPPSIEIGIRDKFVTINGFIESRSIGVSGREFKSEAIVKDGRVRGKVFTQEPYEFFGDTIQLSLDLDVELMMLVEGPAPIALAMDEDYVYPVPRGSDEVLLVQLQTVDAETEFAIEARDVELARNGKMVPKPGQAKILLGNTTEAEVVVVIDEREYRIGAGVGSDGPAEAMKIDVKPGKYAIVIRVPGEDPQTETIDVEPDTTWGVVAFGDEAYFTDRVY
jgi:hypothetical protein